MLQDNVQSRIILTKGDDRMEIKGCEVKLFDEKITYSAGKMLDIHLKVYMSTLEKQIENEVEKMFVEAESFLMLLVLPRTYMRDIYSRMYNAAFLYLKSILPLADIKIEDIILPEDKEYLWNQYKSRDKEIDERMEFVQTTMALERVKYSKRSQEEEKKIEKNYEKESYDNMKFGYKKNVIYDILNLQEHIENKLMQAGIPIEIITKEDQRQALDIATFVFSYKRLSKEEKKPYILELLRLDPVDSMLPENIMKEFPERINEIIKVFTDMGLPISNESISRGVDKLFNSLPHETENDLLSIKQIVDNIPENYDISKNPTVINLNKTLEVFDVQARSFMGTVFSTRELKQKADTENLLLQQKYDGFIENMTEEQCLEEKNWIKEQCFIKEVEEIYIEKFNARINDIWKKDDMESFCELCKSTDVFSNESKQMAIKIIRETGKSEEKDLYISALEGMNEENINQYKKYLKWEKKTFLQRYGMFLGIIILSIILGLLSKTIERFGLSFGIVVLVVQMYYIKKAKNVWKILSIDGRITYAQLSEEKNI